MAGDTTLNLTLDQLTISELIDFKSNKMLTEIENFVQNYSSKSALEYIKQHCDITSESTNIVSTTTLFNVKKSNEISDAIINLHRINDIRYINKFFEGIHEELPFEGKFICCVETFHARRKRKKIGRIPVISSLYFFFEFIFMRVFPKIRFLKTIYFMMTRGKKRLLSKAESLGRLISCGFEIVDFKERDGILYIVSVKKKEPRYDMNPSYGPVYKMPRVGKNKKIINVYKLRTMHSYSEYLQCYMFEKHGTANGDKVINDFRISKIGKIFRRCWIDELPMIINLVKGDLKIVGVRPLSMSKFNMYPEYAQEARVLTKPGLVPPFYVDLPETFEELVESEMKYVEKYRKSPFITDVTYFFKALYNIFIKGARSK